LILDHADRLLADEGYLGFNLDRLADQIDYSKATIYNHFSSKEDVIGAVASRHFGERAKFFARALDFPGHSRERMCCVGAADEILARTRPNSFPVVQLTRTHSIWEKLGNSTRADFEAAAQQCVDVGVQIIREAREVGDLVEEGKPLPDLGLFAGLIALAKGTYLLGNEESPFYHVLGDSPADCAFDFYNAYLDGIGWRPLSRDWDYAASRERAVAYLRAGPPTTDAAPVAGRPRSSHE
jgi:AcrR family transcriptional regulator